MASPAIVNEVAAVLTAPKEGSKLPSRALFVITGDMNRMNELLDEMEGDLSKAGELEEEFTKWIESLAAEQGEKLDGYVNLIKRFEMEARKAREEAQIYQTIARAREKKAEWLEMRIKKHMEDTKQTKLQTASGRTIAIVKTGGMLPLEVAPTVRLEEMDRRFIIISRALDSAAIREAMKAGEKIDGITFGTHGTHLRIK